MVSFKTLPGELPRDIAMERRRREIASVDFITKFEHFIEETKKKPSRLSLELFDDDIFETKSLKAWFDIAQKVTIFDQSRNQERVVKGLYGNCYIGEWKKCIVIG